MITKLKISGLNDRKSYFRSFLIYLYLNKNKYRDAKIVSHSIVIINCIKITLADKLDKNGFSAAGDSTH